MMNTVVVHFLYTASDITSIYTEILVQYHSKGTDTVCSITLKREQFSIFRLNVFLYICMLPFYQIPAWVFLIHMFLYAGFYCMSLNGLIICFQYGQSFTTKTVCIICLFSFVCVCFCVLMQCFFFLLYSPLV